MYFYSGEFKELTTHASHIGVGVAVNGRDENDRILVITYKLDSRRKGK